MNRKLTAAGAKQVTDTFDRMANLVQAHYALLGIPEKIALDYAYRTDLLSDHISKQIQAADFDESQVGKDVPGPLEGDKDEPYMKGEFTQQENHELHDKQEGGGLGKAAQVKAQADAAAAKLAALELGDTDLAAASVSLKGIHAKLASGPATEVASNVAKLVAAVDHVASVLANPERFHTADLKQKATAAADKIKQAAAEVVPTFNLIASADASEFEALVQDAAVAKLAALAAKVAEAAAGSVVVAGEAPADEEPKEEAKDDEPAEKTASTDEFFGFNLFA